MTNKLSFLIFLLGLTIPLGWLAMGNTLCADDLSCQYEGLFNYMAATAALGTVFFLVTINMQRRAMDRVIVRDRRTGLYSRHHFFDLLRGEFDRATRHGQHFTVLLFAFENLDLTTGAGNGNHSVRRFFRAIRSSVRSSDILARTDRNEFALILPNTDADGGRVLANRLNTLAANIARNSGVRSSSPLVLAAGLANCRDVSPHSGLDMYTYARKALASAQDSPRNKVVDFATRPTAAQ